MQCFNSILNTIGNTPIVKLSKISLSNGSQIFAKCEMFNPSMSVKDRIVLKMIRQFEKEGKLKPGGTIVEASSGNTGSALAMLAARMGYKAIIITPYKTSEEKVNTMRAFGAEVNISPKDITKDSPEHYVNKAQKLAEEIPEAVHLNQYQNQVNPHTHYDETGKEIWQQLDGKIDYLVAAASSGGTVTGIGRYLKEKDPSIKVIMPDPEGSIYHHYFHHKNLDTKPKPYNLEGIGKDYICGTIDFSVIDDVVKVTDQQAFETARMLARTEGILAGGSSGASLFVALQLADELNQKNEKKNIVIILPDSGIKYLSKFYKSVK